MSRKFQGRQEITLLAQPLGVFALLPLAATFPAVPQFLPQLARVRRAGGVPRRPLMLVSLWAVVLLTATAVSGRTGLGSALAVAFALQVPRGHTPGWPGQAS
jgi:hypothetical protein